MTCAIAYGRIGLLGNPSDIYGGKVISFTFQRYAHVEIEDSPEFKIIGYEDPDNDLGNRDSHKLIKAIIIHLKIEERLREHPISIKYESNVPIGAGLSGSSAIIIAFMRAINKHYNLGMDDYKIAEEATIAENEQLGITAGFQDRYAISFGGILYMDFSGKEYMQRSDPLGKIERLEVSNIPIFLAGGMQPKRSAVVHNPLRERFLKGCDEESKRIKEHMDRIAALTIEGKDALLKRDWNKLGNLMNINTILRGQISPGLPMDNEMIRDALSLGALGAKVAGSGGSIIFLTDEEDSKNVVKQMEEMGYFCSRPRITRYDECNST